MFSFLHPLALWFGLFALIPLVIHFMGRSKTRKLLFPSLLLFQEQLVRVSRKHRIRNFLLLACRTLFIISLLLALINPVYHGQSPVSETSRSIVLINNGAWAGLRDKSGQTLFQRQLRDTEKLDSLSSGKVKRVYLFGSASSEESGRIHSRFGDYAKALWKISTLLDESRGVMTHVHLPLFRWSDLVMCSHELTALCKTYPLLRIIIMDFSAYTQDLEQLSNITTSFSFEKPVITLNCLIEHPRLEAGTGEKLQVFLNGKLNQETTLSKTPKEKTGYMFSLPFPSEKFASGSLVLKGAPENTPYSQYHFSYLLPGQARILHAGTDLTSLPSLGKAVYFKSIQHVDRLESDSLFNHLKDFQLIYLSNAEIGKDRAYPRLLEYVRNGGTLLIGVGNNTDISRLNREILVPSKMGYLTPGKISVPDERRPADAVTTINLHGQSISPREHFLHKFNPVSYVNRQLLLKENKQVLPVLSNAKGLLLVKRSFKKGAIYLWTTDIDNLEWTGIGVTAFVPTFHQWVFNQSIRLEKRNLSGVSDSVYIHPLTAESRQDLLVLGPHDEPFKAFDKHYGELHLGPFSELGHYKILQGTDTTVFAVNLMRADKASSQEDYLQKIKPCRKQHRIVEAHDSLKTLRGTFHPLWKLFILSAIMFLFFEILIARFFSLK
ncbi:BatA domain-containing protein [Fibrobacterota bacterium]